MDICVYCEEPIDEGNYGGMTKEGKHVCSGCIGEVKFYEQLEKEACDEM